jgi:hypothetical protein
MIHYICIATENKCYLPYLKRLIPDLVIIYKENLTQLVKKTNYYFNIIRKNILNF